MIAKGDYITLFTKGDIDVFREMGKDGYIEHRKANEYVIFDSNQAKRIDNTGSFSTKSKLVLK